MKIRRSGRFLSKNSRKKGSRFSFRQYMRSAPSPKAFSAPFMKTLVLGVVLLVACAFSAYGAERVLRVSYPSQTSFGSLPLWLSKEAGIFQKYGVNVELVYVVSPLAVSALFSGDIQIATGASVGLAALHSEGNRDFVAFASITDKLTQSIY